MGTAFHKLRQLYRDFGLVNSNIYLANKLLSALSPRLRLYKYLLVAQPVPPSPLLPRGGNLVIKMIAEAEYDVTWFPAPAKFIAARYRQNARCFVAFKNAMPVACLWLKQGPYREDTVRCYFVPQPESICVWDFDVYIAPQYRLGRTFVYLWDHVFAWMREQGIEWTMSRIDAINTGSVRSHQRLGTQTLAGIVFFSIGRWQLILTSIRPYLNCSYTGIPRIPLQAPSRNPLPNPTENPSTTSRQCCAMLNRTGADQRPDEEK